MSSVALRFRDELKDFWHFIRRPRLGPRLPAARVGKGWWVDWSAGINMRRLIQWAGVLWLLNMMIFGPLAMAAATAGGAQHRLDIENIPWLHAIIWAPIVEELVFRYGLRRPAQLLWLWPLSLVCLLAGPVWYAQVLLWIALLLMMMGPAAKGRPIRWAEQGSMVRAWLWGAAWPWSWRKRYRRYFGLCFWASTIIFAAVHLYNFNLHQVPYYLWAFLVLPQCFTGLALGWLRVRYGIGASIALHALFNSGPLLVIFLILSLLSS